MEIKIPEKNSVLWFDTIDFAEKCSWRAGKELARLMREDCFNDLESVFTVVHDNNIIGFCTLSEKDELPPEYPFTPFIGFVFVDENYRGRRVSEKLIKQVIIYAKNAGFDNVYIMSSETGFYEKYGFEKIGDYDTIYGEIEQLFVISTNRKENTSDSGDLLDENN